jgi:hypothetical protein
MVLATFCIRVSSVLAFSIGTVWSRFLLYES